MKNLFLLAVLAVAGLTEAVAQKLGHLNAQEILFAMPESAEAQSTIEATAAEYESEATRMQGELETKYTELQAKADTWPDAIRQQKEREFQQLQLNLQEFGVTAENDLALLQQNLLNPIIQRLNDAIDAVGKEHGYTYIFDTNSMTTVYNGGDDVTDLVKTKLGM